MKHKSSSPPILDPAFDRGNFSILHSSSPLLWGGVWVWGVGVCLAIVGCGVVWLEPTSLWVRLVISLSAIAWFGMGAIAWYWQQQWMAIQQAHQACAQSLQTLQQESLDLRTAMTDEVTAYAALLQEVQEREIQFRRQYEKLPIPVCTWRYTGDDFLFVGCNEAAIALTEGEVLNNMGKRATEILSDYRYAHQDLAECLLTKTPMTRSLHLPALDIHLQLRYLFIPPNWVMVLTEDITAQHRSEIQLKLRLRQQSTLAELGQLGLTTPNLANLMHETVQLVSRTLRVKYCAVFEYLTNGHTLLLQTGVGWKKDLIGQLTMSASSTSQVGYTLEHGAPVIVKDLRVESRFRGAPLLHNHRVISSVSVVIDGEGEPYGVLGIYTDRLREFNEDDARFLQAVSHILTTAIKRDRQAEQLNLMKRAIDSSQNSIVISDAITPGQPILYANSGFEQITGYQVQEVVGQSVSLLYGSGTTPQTLKAINHARFQGQDFHGTLRYYRKDGTPFWMELNLAPVHDQHNALTHFIEVQTDITERKQFEETLRNERDLLNGILQTSIAAILVINTEGQLTFANERAEAILGLNSTSKAAATADTPTSLHSRHSDQLNIEQYALPVTPILQEGHPVFDLHHTMETAEGDRQYLSINGAPLCDVQGNITAAVLSITDITEQYQAEIALRQSEEQFRLLFELAPIGIFLCGMDGRFQQVNPALCSVLGYTAEQLQQLHLSELTHPDDHAADLAINQKLLLGEIDQFQIEKRFISQQNMVVHTLVRVVMVYGNDGQPSHEVGQVVDISDRKWAEEALLASEKRLEGILGSIEDVVWSAEPRTFAPIYFNPAAAVVFGRSLPELFSTPRLWLSLIHGEDQTRFTQHLHLLNSTGVGECEYRIVRPNGELRWLLCRSRLVYDENEQPVRIDGISSDITERRMAEAQLRRNAFYDSLTELPNRALFMDRLWHTIRRARRRGGYLFAVLFLDIDSFKVVNDSLGHTVGDDLLIAIARRLEDYLRPSDTLARLGGDEFTILLEEISDRQEALTIADRIHSALRTSFHIQGYDVFAETSIGIAFSQLPDTPKDSIHYHYPEDLLRDADTAMYRAKALGKGRYAVFHTAMHQRALARLELETDLRRAVERQEFVAYYQPIMNLHSGKISGFEALIRWQHPDKGLVSPIHFIPIAEETGLIIPMGWWMLQAATDQLAQWQHAYPLAKNLVMNVNLSGRQMGELDLVDMIDYILDKTGLASRYLKLEITESMLMNNATEAKEVLTKLRSRDVLLGIDDFGTGYSSLSYLDQFPVNTLKIDRSFVMRIKADGEDSEIVQAIINLAHILGMDVVAEGIDAPMQVAYLKRWGCDFGQGYYFARPLPAPDAEAFLQKNL